MYRIIFFVSTLILPLMFGWWLFIPLAILAVYLAKLPYEIIISALILDSFYYFGSGFISMNRLTIFSGILIIIALFLSDKIYWRKVI